MEGGLFLIQRVELERYGQKVRGIEVIGHLRPFGDEPSEDIKSRFYDNLGNTLDYVYELEGDTLTIWGREKGSPAYYRGNFGDDGYSGTTLGRPALDALRDKARLREFEVVVVPSPDRLARNYVHPDVLLRGADRQHRGVTRTPEHHGCFRPRCGLGKPRSCMRCICRA